MAIRRKILHDQHRLRLEQPSPPPLEAPLNNGFGSGNGHGNSFMSLSSLSAAISVGGGTPLPALPPTSKVWPDEYVLEDPSKKIYDAGVHSELGEFIKRATADMAENELILRQRCAAMRLLPERERRRYGCSHNCEWIADPMFALGKGSEATIYMGLYQDPAHPNRDSVLVALKQSHDDTNPFNSREEDHLMGLKRQAGIAQYHTSFTYECGAMALFVLVQDIGLLSLRDLVSGKA